MNRSKDQSSGSVKQKKRLWWFGYTEQSGEQSKEFRDSGQKKMWKTKTYWNDIMTEDLREKECRIQEAMNWVRWRRIKEKILIPYNTGNNKIKNKKIYHSLQNKIFLMFLNMLLFKKRMTL